MVEAMILVLVGLIGLAWGSFLNVVIYRVPREMSLLKPPSTCPGCQKRIKPYDNVPFFSYLILRGKCRHCGFRIPFSYFLVEVLTPASFGLLYFHHDRTMGLPFIASCLFASAMIALGFIDYYHQILPDVITMPGLVLALGYGFVRQDMSFRQALIGAAVGSGFLLFVYGAYFLVRRKEGLGMGDVTMMLVIGAFLGWLPTVLTLVLASFAGAAVGIFFILFRKKDMQFALPFGTFLAPAALVTLLWGERIIRAYLALFR
ncbi:prepilin peptidase [bacterium]|nr:MAG: prepilin peptidase [bacterium]